MRIKRCVLYIWLVALLSFGCSSESNDPDLAQLGYNYYPVEVGNYRIYDVQEINFTLLDGGDTTNYQLKEVIDAYQHQSKEDTSYYLHRFTRSTTEEEWQLDSLWTIRKDLRRVVVVENNVPVIKLVFPVGEGVAWDANAMNAEEGETYTMMDVGIPFETEVETFDHTLSVIEKDNMDTVITERFREAVYADGIGMVYKEERFIDYCATTVECLGLGIIEGGSKSVHILREYGKE